MAGPGMKRYRVVRQQPPTDNCGHPSAQRGSCVSSQSIRIALSVLAVLGVGAADAQSNGQPSHFCAAIPADAQRLTCYDDVFGRPTTGAAVTTARINLPSAAPVPGIDPAADFGLSEAAKRARDPEKAMATMPVQISGRVAEVSRRPTGELVVTLEGGQVWAQIDIETKAVLKPGDSVTIKKAALGSYLLVTPNRVATRVRRLR